MYTNTYVSVTKIGWNSLHWFFRYGVHKIFRTHRLRHSLTDRQTWMQHASGTVFPMRRISNAPPFFTHKNPRWSIL